MFCATAVAQKEATSPKQMSVRAKFIADSFFLEGLSPPAAVYAPDKSASGHTGEPKKF
jgi:hypothetical protein